MMTLLTPPQVELEPARVPLFDSHVCRDDRLAKALWLGYGLRRASSDLGLRSHAAMHNGFKLYRYDDCMKIMTHDIAKQAPTVANNTEARLQRVQCMW